MLQPSATAIAQELRLTSKRDRTFEPGHLHPKNQISMCRDKFTEKLKRMLATIDAGAMPMKVREFYVFGSYARGALDPGDLDVLVVHKEPKAIDLACWGLRRKDDSHEFSRAYRKFQSEMRRRLRNSGERVDVLLTNDFDDMFDEETALKPVDFILLWCAKDRDWPAKLARISPNASAGRFHRNHFFPIRRLRASLREMDVVARLLQKQALLLNRIEAESIEPVLSPYHAKKLLLSTHVIGQKSLEIVPFALWWLEQNNQQFESIARKLVFWSSDRTHCITSASHRRIG